MLKTTRYYLYLLSIIIITLVNCLVGLSPSGTFTKLRTSLFLSIMALSEFKKMQVSKFTSYGVFILSYEFFDQLWKHERSCGLIKKSRTMCHAAAASNSKFQSIYTNTKYQITFKVKFLIMAGKYILNKSTPSSSLPNYILTTSYHTYSYIPI